MTPEQPGPDDQQQEPIALPEEIRLLVAAVPGVSAVYPAQPVPQAVISSTVAHLTRRPPANPVEVASATEGLEIGIAIGVSDDASATETCRAVFDAVSAHLAATAAGPAARIRVVVATVG